ncbi:hypothetical protein C0995_008324, partial [Termitomyces sp. Mi166
TTLMHRICYPNQTPSCKSSRIHPYGVFIIPLQGLPASLARSQQVRRSRPSLPRKTAIPNLLHLSMRNQVPLCIIYKFATWCIT